MANSRGVSLRRPLYWGSLLALVAAWFMFGGASGLAACQAATSPPPLDEFGTNGLSYFPPGYRCLYIDGNTVEPLDAAGWRAWTLVMGILLLLIYGVLSFVVRLSKWRTRPHAH